MPGVQQQSGFLRLCSNKVNEA